MLQFYKTKNSRGLEVSINPSCVSHIEEFGLVDTENWSKITMNLGQIYIINENCYKLTDKLEKLANYDGC